MKTRYFAFVILISLMAASGLTAQISRPPHNLKAGAVYVMTNQPVNSIMAFARNPKSGVLALVDTEPTGGAGDPVPIPPDPPIDPLASQGSLVLSGNDYLYAVNAGSNEISVLEVRPHSLEFVQKISSGGLRPISLTVHNDTLYVLNEGGTPNITGFRIDDNGVLTAIAGSARPLIGGSLADPAQVGFSPGGDLLVVTEKMGNRLNTYQVDGNGIAGPPMANPSSGMTPFGFAFGHEGALIVSEAFGGMPGASAVSSYMANGSGMLNVLSASVPNGQTAACWLVSTGRFAFVSNTGSDTLSSYVIGRTGSLALLAGVAANTGDGSAPVDMALSNNNHFLYTLENGSHTVGAYEVDARGNLTFIGDFGTLPPGSQGIASK